MSTTEGATVLETTRDAQVEADVTRHDCDALPRAIDLVAPQPRRPARGRAGGSSTATVTTRLTTSAPCTDDLPRRPTTVHRPHQRTAHRPSRRVRRRSHHRDPSARRARIGRRTIDLGDVTVLPGLIDTHQHLCFDGNGTLQEQVEGRSDAELQRRAYANAKGALQAGITTIRDLGDRNFVTLDLRADPDLPTILAAGPPLTADGGHCWYLGGGCRDPRRPCRGRTGAQAARRRCGQDHGDRWCFDPHVPHVGVTVHR